MATVCLPETCQLAVDSEVRAKRFQDEVLIHAQLVPIFVELREGIA
jgi:hypothetical protein